MASQKSWKNMGMLASVANCGRSRKLGYRGRLVLGFKPSHGSHDKNHHVALAEKHHAALAKETHVALGLPLPHSRGSWKARCSSNAELSLSSLEECRRDTAGRKGVKGLLAGGPGEGAMWFWLKNWRSRRHSWWCWELREACQLSTDYWEEPAAT